MGKTFGNTSQEVFPKVFYRGVIEHYNHPLKKNAQWILEVKYLLLNVQKICCCGCTLKSHNHRYDFR